MNFDREFQMSWSDKTGYVCDYHMYLRKAFNKLGLRTCPRGKNLKPE